MTTHGKMSDIVRVSYLCREHDILRRLDAIKEVKGKKERSDQESAFGQWPSQFYCSVDRGVRSQEVRFHLLSGKVHDIG